MTDLELILGTLDVRQVYTLNRTPVACLHVLGRSEETRQPRENPQEYGDGQSMWNSINSFFIIFFFHGRHLTYLYSGIYATKNVCDARKFQNNHGIWKWFAQVTQSRLFPNPLITPKPFAQPFCAIHTIQIITEKCNLTLPCWEKTTNNRKHHIHSNGFQQKYHQLTI